MIVGVGGLGHIALQCLHEIFGCRIIAVDREPAARQLCKELGADFVLDGGPNIVEEIKEITGGGAQVVMDFVGELGVENLCWKMVRPGGELVMIGYGGKIEVPTAHLVINEISRSHPDPPARLDAGLWAQLVAAEGRGRVIARPVGVWVTRSADPVGPGRPHALVIAEDPGGISRRSRPSP